jgi:uncharacterized membrane protein
MDRQMETMEHTVEVDAPLRTTYNQWTQFEDFPRFMEGVESVTQLDDKRLHWVAKVGGRTKTWDSEITRQVPDQEIDWLGFGDPDNRGRLVFEEADGGAKTRVTLALDYEPQGAVEGVADKLGLVRRRVERDMQNFKEFLEARGRETGEWRGEIHGGDQA